MRSPGTAAKSSPRLPQLEKACAQQWKPNTAKKNKKQKKKERNCSDMNKRCDRKIKTVDLLGYYWKLLVKKTFCLYKKTFRGFPGGASG